MKAGVLARRFVRKRLKRFVSIRSRFDVGRCTYGEPYVYQWGESSTLRVGSFCSIADDVTIFLGGDHRVDWITTYPFSYLRKSARHIEGHPRTKGDVNIGNDVWIGTGASILSGVTIGDGAVIGAYAVVAKDVPSYTIVVGNPAAAVRKRFSDDEIATLERIAWWRWPDSLIDEAMPFLLSSDVAALSAFADEHPDVLLLGT
jgi:acetyltransferase-like isoleucine patch superfamily enzyme